MTEKDHAKRWHMRSGHTATEYFRTFKGRGWSRVPNRTLIPQITSLPKFTPWLPLLYPHSILERLTSWSAGLRTWAQSQVEMRQCIKKWRFAESFANQVRTPRAPCLQLVTENSHAGTHPLKALPRHTIASQLFKASLTNNHWPRTTRFLRKASNIKKKITRQSEQNMTTF
jgi:hypothetical protein